MGFNEVLSSWSSSEEEDGHDLDEDRDQVLPKPFNTTIGPPSFHSKGVFRKKFTANWKSFTVPIFGEMTGHPTI